MRSVTALNDMESHSCACSRYAGKEQFCAAARSKYARMIGNSASLGRIMAIEGFLHFAYRLRTKQVNFVTTATRTTNCIATVYTRHATH